MEAKDADIITTKSIFNVLYFNTLQMLASGKLKVLN